MVIGRKLIITNAHRKHSQRMTRKDRKVLEAAINARADYLSRTREGTYDVEA